VARWHPDEPAHHPQQRQADAGNRRLLESPEGEHLPRRKLHRFAASKQNCTRNLDGIVKMERAPAAMFVIDIMREAMRSTKRSASGSRSLPLWTPIADPDHATYPIAGNDDAIRAVKRSRT